MGLQSAASNSDSESDLEQAALQSLIEKHRTDLTPEQQQERTQRQEWVTQAVSDAKTMEEVLTIVSTFVETDWLFAVEEINGDMYRMAAFGGIRFGKLGDTESNARVLGLCGIFIIQLLAPVGIAMQNMSLLFLWKDTFHHNIQALTFSADAWSGLSSTDVLKKFLGMVFLFCVLLDCLYHLSAELNGWHAIQRLLRILKDKQGINEYLIYLGAFMDCWVVGWVSFDAFLVLGTADSIKDLVFDALGLTFLFHLDDLTGDFGFTSDMPWPGKNLGWLEQAIKTKMVVAPSRLVAFMYQTIRILLVPSVFVLPIIFAVTKFEVPAGTPPGSNTAVTS